MSSTCNKRNSNESNMANALSQYPISIRRIKEYPTRSHTPTLTSASLWQRRSLDAEERGKHGKIKEKSCYR